MGHLKSHPELPPKEDKCRRAPGMAFQMGSHPFSSSLDVTSSMSRSLHHADPIITLSFRQRQINVEGLLGWHSKWEAIPFPHK
ncbi:MAG: hypothetical protein CVU00_13275 [Bacteroidetes bacterium HGW-Bacteroidetes-17]|nr:MAG: hypothetical protein CVU00_13275 [Bacteroidetes bacterium HGW-Bacteroidetes-17]